MLVVLHAFYSITCSGIASVYVGTQKTDSVLFEKNSEKLTRSSTKMRRSFGVSKSLNTCLKAVGVFLLHRCILCIWLSPRNCRIWPVIQKPEIIVFHLSDNAIFSPVDHIRTVINVCGMKRKIMETVCAVLVTTIVHIICRIIYLLGV